MLDSALSIIGPRRPCQETSGAGGWHERRLASSAELHMFAGGEIQAPTDWSADGRFVAFVNTGFPRFRKRILRAMSGW